MSSYERWRIVISTTTRLDNVERKMTLRTGLWHDGVDVGCATRSRLMPDICLWFLRDGVPAVSLEMRQEDCTLGPHDCIENR